MSSQDWKLKYDKYVLENTMDGKTYPKNKEQVDIMFELWNDKYLPFETDRHCGSCRRRIAEKLIARVTRNGYPQ